MVKVISTNGLGDEHGSFIDREIDGVVYDREEASIYIGGYREPVKLLEVQERPRATKLSVGKPIKEQKW